KPLVEGGHRELEYLSTRASEVGEVALIASRRPQGGRYQRHALDHCPLDRRREALRIFLQRLPQDLDAEVDVAGLVARHGGEALVEAEVGVPEVAHGFQAEAKAGEGERGLDDDVVDHDALDEGDAVTGIA